jgi:hypothetical protein
MTARVIEGMRLDSKFEQIRFNYTMMHALNCPNQGVKQYLNMESPSLRTARKRREPSKIIPNGIRNNKQANPNLRNTSLALLRADIGNFQFVDSISKSRG